MRAFGLDVHRDFCEVAIAERRAGAIGGADRDAGAQALELFAQSLVAGDVVALEATTGPIGSSRCSSATEIRVVVANTRKLQVDHRGEGQDRSPGRADVGQAADVGSA